MMQTGRKQILKDGDEYDLLYAKGFYCYLRNNNKLVRYIHKKMNRRRRREDKHELNKILEEEGYNT